MLDGRREIDLDFLRGLAILMVLDFHAPVHWMSRPLHLLGFPNFGWAGVDVFFVLSGFLVGGLLIKEWRAQKRIDSRRFLIRRGFKIWPQYYVFLGMMLLTRHRTLHELWGNLLNVQNYVGGIPHTWSLAVEEHAYLLLLLGLSLAARWRVQARSLALVIAVLCAVIVLGRLVLIEHGFEVVNRTHTRIEGILYGVLLALVYHHDSEAFRRWQARRWIWWAVAAAALVFFRFQTSSPWASSVGWDMADAFGVALLMLLYRPSRPGTRTWTFRVVAWIGVYSYGIYLWHVSVIAPAVAIGSRLPHWAAEIWLCLAPIAAGIGLGAAFTRVVELPALKLRDRLFPPRIGSPLQRTSTPRVDTHAVASQVVQVSG
ncbi:MAG TPA: acyltransferase [Acidobacteriaceae bacterium]|nr:acyltransferase [Acidobacteriaceae bacterium]